MIDEAPMSDRTRLSPRAGIAVLSLQLRSTVQEAIEAEAAADAIDVEGALWQLRSRLTPLIDERRRALDDEVAEERARGAEAIAAARLQAERVVVAAIEAVAARAMAGRAAAELARRATEAQALWEPVVEVLPEPDVEVLPEPDVEVLPEPVVEVLPEPDVAAPIEPDVAAPIELEAPVELASPVLFDQAEFWAPEVDAADSKPLSPPPPPVLLLRPPPPPVLLLPPPELPVLPPPSAPMTLVLPELDGRSVDELAEWAPNIDRGGPQPLHVVLDADSFARAFAAAMAPILEARAQAPQYLYPPPGYVAPQAPPVKRSFWAHAWHPDVLLSGLAMVIVIIVLIAWTG